MLNPLTNKRGKPLYVEQSCAYETACWIWSGRRDGKGYGRIKRDGKDWIAHRFVYTQMVGSIPAGLTLDHLCYNPLCVNPDHMEPVTNGENVRRSKARITHCPRGHPYEGDNLRFNAKGARVCRTCLREKGREQHAKHRDKRLRSMAAYYRKRKAVAA